MDNASNRNRPQVSLRALLPFLLITFGIAWGIFALYIFVPTGMEQMFGPLTGQHPLFFLAVYAPAIAAFLIVTYTAGIDGLKRYLSRLLLWCCSAGWLLFLFVGMPLVFFVGSAWKGNLFDQPFPFTSLSALLVALAFTAIKGPVEEFGWRGLALPLVQRRVAPLWAGLLIGFVWGLWHLPAFVLSGTPQSAWSFTPFFAGSIALSVIVTGLFNQSKGSILLPAFFHFQANNPLWPDAQPYDTYLLIGVAVLVVWFDQDRMLDKAGGVTRVVPAA